MQTMTHPDDVENMGKDQYRQLPEPMRFADMTATQDVPSVGTSGVWTAGAERLAAGDSLGDADGD